MTNPITDTSPRSLLYTGTGEPLLGSPDVADPADLFTGRPFSRIVSDHAGTADFADRDPDRILLLPLGGPDALAGPATPGLMADLTAVVIAGGFVEIRAADWEAADVVLDAILAAVCAVRHGDAQ